MSAKGAWELVIDWMTRVGLPDPEQFINKYPHELSGGQKQRVLVAMALFNLLMQWKVLEPDEIRMVHLTIAEFSL